MIQPDARQVLFDALDRWLKKGRCARLWLRDDDAVKPTPELDRFLATVAPLPVTLAVIPERTDAPLARRLEAAPQVTVALHGWSHANHAPPGEKKQELGAHRPLPLILSELEDGLSKLEELHRGRMLPMLVPPWNRIAPGLTAHLPALGIRCLSVFGREKAGPLPMLNTHVDVIDWHGTRGGRDGATLLREVAQRLDTMEESDTMGLLTHHLVHDAAVDRFLEDFAALTSTHPGCRWISAAEAMAEF